MAIHPTLETVGFLAKISMTGVVFMVSLRKVQRRLYSLVTFIGCLLVFASIMALVYEVTLEPDQPSVLRASWAKLRDNPMATVQAMVTDAGAFFKSATVGIHTSSSDTTPPIVAAPPAPARSTAPAPTAPNPPTQTTQPREQPAVSPSPRVAAPAATPVPPVATPAAGPVFMRELYDEGIRLINEDRRRHGVHTLKVHPTLTKLAEKKAMDMIKHGYFDHYSPRLGWPQEMAKGYFSLIPVSVAENLSTNGGSHNFSETIRITRQHQPHMSHRDLMESKGHRKHILGNAYTHVGYALIVGKVGNINTAPDPSPHVGSYTSITVQLFMQEPRTDIHSIRMELVNTPVFVPGQPTTVTVRALAEHSGARPYLSHSVGIIISDERYINTQQRDRQFGHVHPGDTFTVTLQATPADATRFSHFINLQSHDFSPDHAERREASLRFSKFSAESTSIWVTHTWRDAAGAERIDEWELPLP
ncbi:MAG: hypothetical protein KGZ57_09065 [Dethiobacter sp.]|nr:hypothetical protein [Dethiobacter sp.]